MLTWFAASAGSAALLLLNSQAGLAAQLALVVALAVLGIALRDTGARLWAVVAFGSMVAVGATVPSQGRSLLAVSLLGVVACTEALEQHSLVRILPDRAARTARLPMALVVGAQVACVGHSATVALILLVAATCLTVGYRCSPRLADGADGTLERIVEGATRAVAMALVFLVAIPTLYLPGASLNLLRRPRSIPFGASRWQQRAVTAEQVRRDSRWPFASTPRSVRRARLRVGIVTGSVALVALIAALATGVLPPGDGDEGRPIEFSDFAFPDEPWVDELYEAGFDVTFHPALGWQSTEIDSPHLNVVDGVRQSWTPEAPELTVWFLGGSAMWGLGQRDDHTIASEVARLAIAAGQPIRAVNLAVPGYNQWQEIALMAFRLSRGERPDLIVFYDGANDMTSMIYRAGQGMESLDVPPNRFHEQIETDTRYPVEPRSGQPASRDELVEAFHSMYGSGVDLARRAAAAYGVPTAFYWQPQYLSTRPSAVDAPLLQTFPMLGPGPSDEERAVIAQVRQSLPDGVIDLGSSLDGAAKPTWFDPVHTNELGAAIVADSMWQTLGPRLDAL